MQKVLMFTIMVITIYVVTFVAYGVINSQVYQGYLSEGKGGNPQVVVYKEK